MKLDGYKTYIVGVGTLMYAIGGYISGKLDINLAIVSSLAALQMMGLRNAKVKEVEVTKETIENDGNDHLGEE